MSNRHERRKAAATSRKKLVKLNIDQHLKDMLRRVRAEFERTGGIQSGFECVTDAESFHVPANWPNPSAKAAACAALRASFRRRGVNRYVFAGEAWLPPDLAPADDRDRRERVLVMAVERNGPRRYACAAITRNGETSMLGPWEVNADPPKSWLLELLEDGYSDQASKAEPPPLPRLLAPDLDQPVYEDPAQVGEFRESVEIHDELENLIADQVQKAANGDRHAMFLALESVVRNLVKDEGSPKGVGGFARVLRDHPDSFPMFSIVPDSVPSPRHLHRYKATLQHFICEKREAGCIDSAIFGAFMNMYLYLGSQAVGALDLAGRIEAWDPEHLAKLQQVGLRSSYELDDEEGRVFLALTADRYPMAVVGRRNAVGDLFVSKVVSCPPRDFATAVDHIKQKGIELITGAEARELFCKLDQLK